MNACNSTTLRDETRCYGRPRFRVRQRFIPTFGWLAFILTSLCSDAPSTVLAQTVSDGQSVSLADSKITAWDKLSKRPKQSESHDSTVTVVAQLSYWAPDTAYFFLTQHGHGVRIKRSTIADSVLRQCRPASRLRVTVQPSSATNDWTPVQVEMLANTPPMIPPSIPAGMGFGDRLADYNSFVSLRGRVRAVLIDNLVPSTKIVILSNGGTTVVRLPKAVSPDQAEEWIGHTMDLTGVIRGRNKRTQRITSQKLLMMSESQMTVASSEPMMHGIQFPLTKRVGRLAFRETSGRGVLVDLVDGSPVLFDHPFTAECDRNAILEIRGSTQTTARHQRSSMATYVLIRGLVSQIPGHAGIDSDTPHPGHTEFAGTVTSVSKHHSSYHVLLDGPDGKSNRVFVEGIDEIDVVKLPKLRTGNLIRGTGINTNTSSKSTSNARHLPITRRGDDRYEQHFYVGSLNDLSIVESSVQIQARTLWLLGFAICAIALAGLAWTHTLRRKVEERTKEMVTVTSQLELAFDTVREGVLIGRTNGVTTRVNERFEEIFGFAPTQGSSLNECLNRIGAQFLFPDQLETFRQSLDQYDSGRLEAQLVEPDRTVEIYTKVMQPSINHLDGRDLFSTESPQRLWAFEDVTAQRSLEDELLQSQKMEVVGQLSGGVAHDFNNLLTVMRASLTMITRRSREKIPELSEFTSTAETAINRAAGLTDQLLDFSRRNTLNQQVQDVHPIVRSACSLVRTGSPDSIRIDEALVDVPLMLDVDAARLEQVVANLLLNAADAMLPDGGTIRISTGTINVETPNDRLAIAGNQLTKYVSIDVQDHGIGMTDELMRSVFEPFFTTKPSGVGTGLGLSMAHGIVTQHGGTISVESKIDEGSTFRILLPLHSSEPTGRDTHDNDLCMPARPTQPPWPMEADDTSLHILLVDDLPMVRKAQESLLTELGHRVEPVASGTEAIENLRSNNNYDVMLLDLSMPDIDGTEVFRVAAQTKPNLPVVICTGRIDQASSQSAFGQSRRAPIFLPKPHTVSQLQDSIHKAICSVEADVQHKSVQA